MRETLALGRELGISNAEIRKLVAHVDDKQEILIKLLDQKKLTGVSLAGDGNSPDQNKPKETKMTESEKLKSTDETDDLVPISGPLVFISHDSRDAELAEAFSKLLKSVTPG